MEIKPQELRIGNLVDTKEGIGILVHGGTIAEAEIKQASNGDTGLVGIALTPEWMEKFGFKLVESNELEYYEIYINGINLYEGDKNGFMEVILSGHEESVRVRYVHQLQNLYFALTGKELAIDNKSL